MIREEVGGGKGEHVEVGGETVASKVIWTIGAWCFRHSMWSVSAGVCRGCGFVPLNHVDELQMIRGGQ